MSVTIKTPEDIEKMRVACRLASEVLDYIEPHVKPGVTTEQLDKLCHDYMVDVQGTVPAPLNYAPPGYSPYPKSICTSVNHQVCHGIPGNKALKRGDIVNLDITVIADGYHGDTSRMFIVGDASILAKRLCQVTYECLWIGIDQVRPGAHLGDIGAAIQKHAEGNGFSVVREFCGHGIGRKFHEEPQVLHYGRVGSGMELKQGMIFTIEPMINAGKAAISELPDGWTIVTRIAACQPSGSTPYWSPSRGSRSSRFHPARHSGLRRLHAALPEAEPMNDISAGLKSPLAARIAAGRDALRKGTEQLVSAYREKPLTGPMLKGVARSSSTGFCRISGMPSECRPPRYSWPLAAMDATSCIRTPTSIS